MDATETNRSVRRSDSEHEVGASGRIRVEKRKWDGSLTSTGPAWLVDVGPDVLCWFVPGAAGGSRPASGGDEIWATAVGKWWVVCGKSGADGAVAAIELHAASPVERLDETLVSWIDLDLDFVVRGEHAELVDIDCLHRRARELGYPTSAVHGAWAGICELAPCFTTRAWPFDGTLDLWLASARTRIPESDLPSCATRDLPAGLAVCAESDDA
jgi:hypothetical protein